MNSISNMRQTYDRDVLDEAHVESDAMKQFHLWFEEARKEDILEPNAMTLSTVNMDGMPESRTVLLKGLEDEGFIFYTNYQSAKAQEMQVNPNVSLHFLWKIMHRQVRVSGMVQKIEKEKSEAYFHSRPKGSQIGAWVSPQSQVIANKDVLDARKAELLEKYKHTDKLPLPDFWGGYIVKPTKMEFWQGRPDRLHDRLRYSLTGRKWKLERIAP